MRTIRIVTTVLLAGILSCAHSSLLVSPKDEESIIRNSPNSVDLSQSKSLILSQAKHIADRLRKKRLEEEDITFIENYYATYQATKFLNTGQKLLVSPRSKTKMDLLSFCLDMGKATPASNEVFEWKTDDPAIPYYSEVLRLSGKHGKTKQEKFQELIWNLSNEAPYEEYPADLKVLLEEVDPNPSKVLPSRTKKYFRKKIGSLLGSENLIEDLSGQYLSYAEASSLIPESLQISEKQTNQLSALQGNPDVYVASQSEGYTRQTITLYNPTNSWIEIDLSQYHLAPIRSAQRMGVIADSQLYLSTRELMRTAVKDTVVRNAEYWYDGRLSPKEAAFVRRYPMEALSAYVQSQKTITTTWKHFGRNGEDDESDAFRHFIWAGLLTQQLGEELAREFLNAHEELPEHPSRDQILSTEMDRYNNEEGIRAALDLNKQGSLTLGLLETEARDALKAERLRVLSRKGEPTYPFP